MITCDVVFCYHVLLWLVNGNFRLMCFPFFFYFFFFARRRKQCNAGIGVHPMYVNVDMKNGDLANNWVDSLQAAWAGVQVRRELIRCLAGKARFTHV